MPKLLLVEDDPALQLTIQTALEEKGYAVDAVFTTGEAIERLTQETFPIVISDIYIDERTGLDVLDAAKRKDPQCAVILMTGRGTVSHASDLVLWYTRLRMVSMGCVASEGSSPAPFRGGEAHDP